MTGSADRGSSRPLAGWRSLEPSDFSFHGFGDLKPVEQRKISKLSIRTDPPIVSIVDGAIFVPGRNESNSDHLRVVGGIVTSDGQPVETAQLHRRGGKHFGGLIEQVSVAAESELDEDVIYLGPLFNHFGRFLLDTLARVWYLSEVDPSLKVVFNNTTSAKNTNLLQAAYPSWVFRLLSVFGISLERILTFDQPTRLRRAIVPEPLFEQLYSAHVDMARPFQEVAARIAADVVPSDQPLYLSRRRLRSPARPIIGESELEDLLRQQGFTIAYPETLTIEDQIRLINSHSHIFSTVGSAAHSILFALGKPSLHLLADRESVPGNFFLCSMLANAPTTIVNCMGSGDRISTKTERLYGGAGTVGEPEEIHSSGTELRPQTMPRLLEVDRVFGYLDQKGFLENCSPATMPGPGSAESLRRRYDEAWFYVRLRKTSKSLELLPADLEREALDLASESWLVSFMLARYYARVGDRPRADALVNRFAALVAEETDDDRLAYYGGDICGMARRIASKCEPETAERLMTIVTERFSKETRTKTFSVPE
ncbi:MAG TPA: glycosyltransferase 61 family protein [Thermomicrobiales bacterium]|nr:glycosyltransferase 61 family protein [Thermomicrobiales bacterium]